MKAALIASALVTLFIPAFGQSQTPAATPVFRIDSSLTLVDVIAENAKIGVRTRELLTTLRREDFQVFDNGHEVSIASFDVGMENTTRPIALWLIVQCSDDQPVSKHSMFLRGRTNMLKPALAHLGTNDVVGVAHWCDNGEAQIDINPGRDVDEALAKIEEILSRKPIRANTRPGELLMQKMIRLIQDEVRSEEPRRLPVFLFLNGDGNATRADEAYEIATDLLEDSGIVYGLNDGGWITDPQLIAAVNSRPGVNQVFSLVHYYSQVTGGEVYSTDDPKLFSNALDYILAQVHLRYTIGFHPAKLDGKRHSLMVKLTPDARKRFPSAELRFRREYIPSKNR